MRQNVVEEVVAWFVGRSVVVITLAFVLGLIVGWLWWQRRKVSFRESHAIAQLTATHRSRRAELTAVLQAKDDDLQLKDDEIAQLRTELETRGETTVGIASGAVTWQGADETQRVPARTVTGPTGALPTVLVPSDPSPETLASLAIPVEEIPGPDGHVLTPPDTSAPPTTSPPTAAAPVLPGAEPVEEPADDDLERIEGIGPRIGTALRGAGIRTFRQLADADTSTLQSALEQAGLRFAPSLPTWSRQARFLADGDEEGFQALTEQLTGGHGGAGTK
jgi:predicted flap endonuclease-1-like 5' DNA nuclease